MTLLLDIGNTHTHAALADGERYLWQADVPTRLWGDGKAGGELARLCGRNIPEAAAICSVVPGVTPLARQFLRRQWGVCAKVLSARTLRGVGLDYPRPETIGADRLANAIAVRHHYGVPAIVVDFGTAVTLDVVDGRGNYIGGVIAPGLSAMTDYLHERTALLPRIRIRPVDAVVGRSTEEAMLIGAVHGYRGMIRELLGRLQRKFKSRHLKVVATGGYAQLIASGMPEIEYLAPLLTLEGLRLWLEKVTSE
jgi:type III pantothenate kinase